MDQHALNLLTEILQNTHDGDDLSPLDLYFIQQVANAHPADFTEAMELDLADLHRRALNGYQPEWFHGIEHLRIDHEGFVYWKDKQVEHFTPGWAYSEEGKNSAEYLAKKCRHLESLGLVPNSINAVWAWEKYENMKPGDVIEQKPADQGNSANGS